MITLTANIPLSVTLTYDGNTAPLTIDGAGFVVSNPSPGTSQFRLLEILSATPLITHDLRIAPHCHGLQPCGERRQVSAAS